MFEDYYFLNEGQVNITAATVGISKNRWCKVNENEIITEEYINVMKVNNFDHLPIISKNENVYEYFKTSISNDFSDIKRLQIKHDDVIPLDTNIKEVIEKFATTGRSFYFLSYYKNISGLITIGNLNCKQVQIYIFSLICDVERALSDFVNSELSDEDIEGWIKFKTEQEIPNQKFIDILKYYSELKNNDLENKLTEHLFLVDFFAIINKFDLNEKLNYSKAELAELSSINELRKRIAHPTRSLLDDNNDIYKLKERLDKVNDLNFRLDKFKKLK